MMKQSFRKVLVAAFALTLLSGLPALSAGAAPAEDEAVAKQIYDRIEEIKALRDTGVLNYKYTGVDPQKKKIYENYVDWVLTTMRDFFNLPNRQRLLVTNYIDFWRLHQEISPTGTFLGDLNGDYRYTALDVMRMRKTLLELAGEDEQSINAISQADMTINGVLDAADLMKLRKRMVTGSINCWE